MNRSQPSRNVIPVRIASTLVCQLILLPVLLADNVRAQESPNDQEALQTGTDQVGDRYQVNGKNSWLHVLIYRGGLLGGFGHNHVISNGNIEGFVLLARDLSQSGLSLGFGVADLVVDDAELRRLKGPDFTKDISDKDRNATRANMLGNKLLQAQQFPQIHIRSDSLKGSLPQVEVEATVAIGGMEYSLVFPATVEITDDSVVASGEIEIRHADIGLAPFTAFLGSIRVRDEIVLQYHIQADRILPQAN